MAEERRATAEEIKEMEERALSVFASERREDLTALVISFILAFLVIIFLVK